MSAKHGLEETRGHQPNSLVDEAGVAYGIKRTGNVPHVNVDSLVGLEIPVHDYVGMGYTGTDLTTVVYKTGGSGGTTVATLTLVYTANVLQSVTKS